MEIGCVEGVGTTDSGEARKLLDGNCEGSYDSVGVRVGFELGSYEIVGRKVEAGAGAGVTITEGSGVAAGGPVVGSSEQTGIDGDE